MSAGAIPNFDNWKPEKLKGAVPNFEDWQPGEQPTSKQAPGFLDSFYKTVQGPRDVLKGLSGLVSHPLDTMNRMADQTIDLGADGIEHLRHGDIVGGGRRLVNGLINLHVPGLGAASEDAGDSLANGNYREGLGKTAGVGVNAAAMALAPRVVPRGLTAAAETITPGETGPIGRAIPNFERAGKNFQLVMDRTGDVPLDLSAPGDIALRAHELAGRGTTLPKIFRDFTRTATQPDAPPMTYEVGRDFASNASRLSSQENQAMTPGMRRQVAGFSKAMNEANRTAADSAGVGDVYDSAMREYRNAARLRTVKEGLAEYGKKAVIGGLGAGSAYVAGKKLVGK